MSGLFCTLIGVLKHHAGEVQLLSHACVAIGNLAANHRGNQEQVGEVGGIGESFHNPRKV